MNYDQAVSANEFVDALRTNLSESNVQAITSLLGVPENSDTPLNVAGTTYNPATGELVTTLPDGSVQALVIDLSQATEAQTIAVEAALREVKVVIINSDVDATMTFNTIERVIVADNGSDTITVNGDRNTTLDGGAGDDSLRTSGGDDSIIGGTGDDSINAGAGDDSIQATEGNDSIDGGSGFDHAELANDSATFSVVNGALVVTSADTTVRLENVDYVTFNGSSHAVITDTSATGDETAVAMRLYQGLLNRDPDADGAEYWAGTIESGVDSAQTAAYVIMASAEYQSLYGNLTDDQFVDMLYQKFVGHAGDAEGFAYWTQELAEGRMDRAQIAEYFADTSEAAGFNDFVIQVSDWI
jgi:Ca2+-binding RTX toxin-like protein